VEEHILKPSYFLKEEPVLKIWVLDVDRQECSKDINIFVATNVVASK
jgi:hypothetical protein